MPSATPAHCLHTWPQPSSAITVSEAADARSRHEARADALTADHRERKARGEKHPIEDFLHTYYPFTPAQLRRWHPGWDVAYPEDADLPLAGTADVRDDGSRRWYRTENGSRSANVEEFIAARGDAIAWIERLLRSSAMAQKPLNLSCFGLHEWAMVYRLGPGEKRHESLPLRLGQAATNRVVEESNLVCTHFDAFRFFTPNAVPLNASAPTRDTQHSRENPACLHAGMDLYKWAMKLVPLVPSTLVLDCFEHAREIRILDMEASPYDCRSLGYAVVPIETSEGRKEYVERQRRHAERSEQLRARILSVLEPLSDLLPKVGL